MTREDLIALVKRIAANALEDVWADLDPEYDGGLVTSQQKLLDDIDALDAWADGGAVIE